MLVFVSQNPDVKGNIGGMMRRIAAIDSIFEDVPRLYLQVSFKRNLRHTLRKEGLISIESINYFLHHRHLFSRLENAACIYVHSAWNGLKISPYYSRYGRKIISDLHGVVPEEESFRGNRMLGAVFNLVERQMVNHSCLAVVVTDQMARHFLDKYAAELHPDRLLTLPNFEFLQTERIIQNRRDGDGLRLIYAGGVEKWQNIDLMLDNIRRLFQARPNVQVDIYVPEPAVQSVQIRAKSLDLNSKVRIGHLPPHPLFREYQKVDAGFVLRDDILLNRVAMPTKLIEYMRWGVVPIVLSPDVGDFKRYGYKYLTLDNLFREAPSSSGLNEMRAANFRVISSISSETDRAKRTLRSRVMERTGLSQLAAAADHRI